MQSRRKFLAAVVTGTATIAGCTEGLSNSDDESNTTSTSQTTITSTSADQTTASNTPTNQTLEFGETAELKGGSLELREPFRRHSALNVMGGNIVVADFQEQALFIRVRANGDNLPSPEDFSLVPGNNPRVRERFQRPGFRSLNKPYEGGGEGWMAFELPAPFNPDITPKIEVETESGMLSWELPESIRSTLNTEPPSFSLRAFEAPNTVTTGEEITVRIEVENTGGAGTFRGGLERTGLITGPVFTSFDVPSGESRHKEIYSDTFESAGELNLTFTGHGIEDQSRTVTIEEK